MRTLLAALTALMLFSAAPTVAKDCVMSDADVQDPIRAIGFETDRFILDKINLRAGPGLRYCLKRVLADGHSKNPEVIGQYELWRQISLEGEIYWVHRSLLGGGWEYAESAYEAGDYEKSLTLLKRLAEQGFASSQSNLGSAYSTREGVPKDYAKAVYWFRKAAEQGDASALFSLGRMYGYGLGVLQDYVQGYAYYSAAAARLYEMATKNKYINFTHNAYTLEKHILEEGMTQEQIVEAQRLASEYWEKYVVPFQKD